MLCILVKLMLYLSLLQRMDQQSFQVIWMEVFIHIQCKINHSKNYLLIILFHMVLVMEKILQLQEMIKKLLFMIHLEMYYKDLTILTMIKLKILLYVNLIHLVKVLLSETSIDFMSTTSIKKEDNGKKLYAKTSKIIILLLLYVGKMMGQDL